MVSIVKFALGDKQYSFKAKQHKLSFKLIPTGACISLRTEDLCGTGYNASDASFAY